MKKAKKIGKLSLSLALSASLIIPMMPDTSFAKANNKSKQLATEPMSGLGNDDDLLPNLVTNPGFNPIPGPNLGPVNGGNGPSNPGPIFNGGNNNNNQNGGRVGMSTATVPAEYSCPLFENRPYDSLNQAIDSLTAVVTTLPECQNQKGSVDAIQSNTENIRSAVGQLQQYMEDPSSAYQNAKVVEENITKAIQSASNIATIFNNNALLNSACGRQTMSTGKALLAFNEILNSLAPYALLAVSLHPGIGIAAKFAITGGTILTSAISASGKMMDRYTLDMTKPDHRKAVLQNTCQFTKVARKVRFLQLAQSGQINKITEELEKSVALYKSRYGKPSKELNQLIAYRGNIEKQTKTLEQKLGQDRFETLALEQQISDGKNDELLTCMMGQELITQSRHKDAYPATVFNNLEDAASLAQANVKIQLVSLKALNETSRQKITALKNVVIDDNNGGGIKMCADLTRSWLSGIKQALKLTDSLINQEKIQVEAELSRNTEYLSWKTQYLKIQDEQNTISRVAKVMKEIAKDSSVIDRSELEQRIRNLKTGLFGINRSFNFGTSPILAWLEHTKSAHDRAMSSFDANILALRRGSYSLTMFGNYNANYEKIAKLKDQNKQAMNDIVTSYTLSNLTIKNLPIGSRGHELACQQLESAWLDWTSALDHLGATEFMCEMIDPYLDNKVEKGITSYCRGELALNGVQRVKSGIQKAKAELAAAQRVNKMSYSKYAKIVGGLLSSMQCPMPAVNVLQQ